VVGPSGQLPASPAPSGSAAPSASVAPSGSPDASPSGSVSEVLIQTDTGVANEFVPAAAEVATGAQVSLTFENVATVPHNLTFGPPIDQATSTVVPPAASEALSFTAPEPGDYQFVCTLHPGMEGTLTVTP